MSISVFALVHVLFAVIHVFFFPPLVTFWPFLLLSVGSPSCSSSPDVGLSLSAHLMLACEFVCELLHICSSVCWGARACRSREEKASREYGRRYNESSVLSLFSWGVFVQLFGERISLVVLWYVCPVLLVLSDYIYKFRRTSLNLQHFKMVGTWILWGHGSKSSPVIADSINGVKRKDHLWFFSSRFKIGWHAAGCVWVSVLKMPSESSLLPNVSLTAWYIDLVLSCFHCLNDNR